jgi:hypothetical protein
MKYVHFSLGLDVLCAGVGVVSGPQNALLAVAGKRTVEGAIRRSLEVIQEWRANREIELVETEPVRPTSHDDTHSIAEILPPAPKPAEDLMSILRAASQR